MLRSGVAMAALLVAAASPAAAGSWSVGVGLGNPYYPPPAPYYGAPPPPPVYYGQPPVYYYPPPPPPVVYTPVEPVERSADEVFNALEAAGYHDFGVMVPGDGIYALSAVNRRGDLVSLEISMRSGQIEDESIITPHRRHSHAGEPPMPQESDAVPPRSRPSHDPNVVY